VFSELATNTNFIVFGLILPTRTHGLPHSKDACPYTSIIDTDSNVKDFSHEKNPEIDEIMMLSALY
jgi:hypothetical protein